MGLFLPGTWFSSWYIVSIDTGHIAQSPQSGPRWSPALKIEPVLFPPSVVQGVSCSAARGIFLDLGSKLCPLHEQVDSSSLDHWGSPSPVKF